MVSSDAGLLSTEEITVKELESDKEAVEDATKREEDAKSLDPPVLEGDTSMLVSDDCDTVAWTAVVSRSVDVVVWLEKIDLSLVKVGTIGSLVKLEDVPKNSGSMLTLLERLPSVDVAVKVDNSGVEIEPSGEAEMIVEELRSPTIEL